MGIDAKNIGLFIWRVLRFSMNITFRCVQKYPVVSGVLLFFFLLYIFLPSAFYFLIYSSPILVCTTVFIRCYWNPRRLKNKNALRDEKKEKEISSVESRSPEAGRIVDRNDRPYLKPQRSVRRNARMKVEEMSKDWDSRVILTNLYNDLLGRTPFFEESPKAIVKEKESSSFDPGESSSHNAVADENILAVGEQYNTVFNSEPSKPDLLDGSVEQYEKFISGVGETEVSSLEDDNEEEAQEDGNNALEWTENDQKNLMDLGDSELERNRRLESLIARRRARKLLKLAVEKSLIDMDSVVQSQIAPIFVSRNDSFDFPNNPDHIPGSAPSVLLPARNPFDIPYDPQEEKPNLMGDSFQQEFSAAQQKEMLFCRHGSFCRGLFTSEQMHDRHDVKSDSCSNTEKRATNVPGHFKFRRQSDMGDHHHLVKRLFPEEGKPMSHIESGHDFVDQRGQALKKVYNSVEGKSKGWMESGNNEGEVMANAYHMESRLCNRSEVQMETDSIRNNDSESSSSFSPRESVQGFNVLNRAGVSENVGRTVGKYPVGNSLTSSIPESIAVYEPSYDSSPSANDKRNFDDHMFYTGKKSFHTPSYSLASDLQVEVSEVGSPPPTEYGNVSSADGESFTYDGDVEKEITSGSEEIWGALSHLPRIEETESNLTEVDESSEEDGIEVGFSDINRRPMDPVVSSTLPAQVAQQDMNDTNALLSSRTEIHDQDMDRKTQGDVKEIMECRPSTSDAFSPENSEKSVHMTNESVVLLPHEVYFEKEIGNISNPIQGGKNLKSVQGSNDRENIDETVVSGANQSFDDSISSNPQREPSIEQVSVRSSSSSSPRSVLVLDKLPPNQISSVNSEEWLHIDNNSLDEQPPENLTLNALQSEEHLVENSTTHSSNNSTFEKLEEPFGAPEKCTEEIATMLKEASQEPSKLKKENANSNALRMMEKEKGPQGSPGKLTEEANISNNDPVIIRKKNEEMLKSVEGSGGESQFSVRQEDIVEQSMPVEVNSSKFIEDTEGNSQELTEGEVITVPLTMNEENVSSTATKDSKEFGKPIEHEDIVRLPMPNGSKGNSEAIRDVLGESEILEEHGTVINPSKAAFETNHIDIPATSVEGKEPTNLLPHTAEVGTMSNVIESASDEMSNEENLNYLGDDEGEYQCRQESKVATNLISIKDTEFKPGTLTEEKAKVGPSNLEGEDKSTNSIKNTEAYGKLIDQENAADPPVPSDTKGESKDLTDDGIKMDKLTSHKIAEEPTESKVKLISIKDTEFKPGTLTEGKAKVGPSNLEGENKSTNSIKNTEVSGKLIGQEKAADPPVQCDTKGESKDLTDDGIKTDKFTSHKIAEEPTESKVKAPNTEKSDGHTESKMKCYTLSSLQANQKK